VLISRTPLRVSFVGGGSDVVSFSAEHGGAVVSTTIDKYVYVVVNKRFEETTRVSYSRTEIVSSIAILDSAEGVTTFEVPRGSPVVRTERQKMVDVVFTRTVPPGASLH